MTVLVNRVHMAAVTLHKRRLNKRGMNIAFDFNAPTGLHMLAQGQQHAPPWGERDEESFLIP